MFNLEQRFSAYLLRSKFGSWNYSEWVAKQSREKSADLICFAYQKVSYYYYYYYYYDDDDDNNKKELVT
jgi:hypothetical protein